MTRMKWIHEEDKLLRQLSKTLSDAKIGVVLGRSAASVAARRRILGIIKRTEWTSKKPKRTASWDEIAKWYVEDGVPVEEIARRANLTYYSVIMQLSARGLHRRSKSAQKSQDVGISVLEALGFEIVRQHGSKDPADVTVMVDGVERNLNIKTGQQPSCTYRNFERLISLENPGLFCVPAFGDKVYMLSIVSYEKPILLSGGP